MDMIFYDLGTYDPRSTENPNSYLNWYVPGRQVKNMLGRYHLDPGRVRSQFENMRATGMSTITLQVHSSNLVPCKAAGACNDGFNEDWSWGELIDSGSGALRPQHRQNLLDIVELAKETGFSTIMVRFAHYNATKWGLSSNWNETEYQSVWNFTADLVDTLEKATRGSSLDYLTDLGVENTGHPDLLDFNKRLWSDYCSTFDPKRSVGFSTIADPFHMKDLNWEQGCTPGVYAFDTYGFRKPDEVYDQLVFIEEQMRLLGKPRNPIYITETYFPDTATAKQVRDYLARPTSLGIAGMMFWQREINAPSTDMHISYDPVANLGSLPLILGPYIKQSIVNPFVSSDSSRFFKKCHAFDTCPFMMHIKPMEKVVMTVGNERRYVACSAKGGDWQVPWFNQNTSYKFEFYAGTAPCDTTDVGQKVADVKVYVRHPWQSSNIGPSEQSWAVLYDL